MKTDNTKKTTSMSLCTTKAITTPVRDAATRQVNKATTLFANTAGVRTTSEEKRIGTVVDITRRTHGDVPMRTTVAIASRLMPVFFQGISLCNPI